MPNPAENSRKIQALQLLSAAREKPLSLGTATRMQLQAKTTKDLSSVKVYCGPAANAACQMMGAKAFTVDGAIVVSQQYHPDSPSGQRLLAHELAHIHQQTSGVNSGGNDAGNEEEKNADLLAKTLLGHRP